jgi:amidohydrolase
MHACGHDGHTAILLSTAAILSSHRAEIKGNVKFIFQPAEESGGGAKPMVEEGVMQGVDGVIGLHLISDFPSGRVYTRAGTIFASANDFVLTVRGRGGHAALPHEAVDPIVIAGYITSVLQTLISRETSPFRPSIITIGSLHAGTTFNIIPETAVMQGTLRTFSNEHRLYLMRRIGEITNGIATAMGGSCEIEWVRGSCPPCTNDAAVSELVRQAAVAALGEENVDVSEVVLSTGSDDMSEFLLAVPGCYFMVGSRDEAKDTHYQHHHPRFNIDEDVLLIGVEVMTRAALNFLES